MTNKIQHIVFLTPGFASSENDSIVIPALAVYLKSLKKTVSQSSLTVISFQFPRSVKQFKWFDIDIIPLNGSDKTYKKLFIWNKAKKKLHELHRELPITCIHSFWIGECSMIGERFATKFNLNHIVTAMGQEGVTKNRYAKYLNLNKNKLIALSKRHSRDLLLKHGVKSEIIPWAIDPLDFPDLQPIGIDILGVGSLIDVKNYALFIKTISFLAKKHPKIRVEIIGGGKNFYALKKQVEASKLKNIIKLAGQQTREEVLSKMAKSNILLHTSNYESFGFVYPEALYSGMKIVSTEVGCAIESEFWKVGNSIEDLAQKCNHFLLNASNYKKRILFSSLDDTIKSYLNLYQSKE